MNTCYSRAAAEAYDSSRLILNLFSPPLAAQCLPGFPYARHPWNRWEDEPDSHRNKHNYTDSVRALVQYKYIWIQILQKQATTEKLFICKITVGGGGGMST